mmetsp:Transcript_5537/g.13977  ORF Transcript_5537/g.13977 Transcript_5537/m.13977 type:complete len:285 (-) Transcript_5537:3-857(-)
MWSRLHTPDPWSLVAHVVTLAAPGAAVATARLPVIFSQPLRVADLHPTHTVIVIVPVAIEYRDPLVAAEGLATVYEQLRCRSERLFINNFAPVGEPAAALLAEFLGGFSAEAVADVDLHEPLRLVEGEPGFLVLLVQPEGPPHQPGDGQAAAALVRRHLCGLHRPVSRRFFPPLPPRVAFLRLRRGLRCLGRRRRHRDAHLLAGPHVPWHADLDRAAVRRADLEDGVGGRARGDLDHHGRAHLFRGVVLPLPRAGLRMGVLARDAAGAAGSHGYGPCTPAFARR